VVFTGRIDEAGTIESVSRDQIRCDGSQVLRDTQEAT